MAHGQLYYNQIRSGGARVKTASYTAVDADAFSLIVFNSATAVTFTLPAPPTSNLWNVRVLNIGAGTVTLAAGSLTYNGSATMPSFGNGSGATIYTDGSSYFGLAEIGPVVPPSNPYDVVSFYVGQPPASQVMTLVTFDRSVNFPGNLSGSSGSCGTNPTATATFTLSKTSGGTTTSVGSVSVSTAGVFTFSTSGGTAVSFSFGDILTVTAPSSQDSTLANVSMTFSGTR